MSKLHKTIPNHIIVFICYLLWFTKPTNCSQNMTDQLALVSIKNSIRQDPFQLLISWNDSLHFCDWHGVLCGRRHPNRVVALNLSSNGLVGSLPSHIGNLSFLISIDLSNNSFDGQIPQEMGRLKRLRTFRLSRNSFSGEIPANLSSCTKRVKLGLDYNKFQGNIPYELGNLVQLQVLFLYYNNLIGNIPPSIGNLSSLVKLDIAYNNLQGLIPREISQLGSLSFLAMVSNNLIGEIPYGIFNISAITLLGVGSNQLIGTIPSNIGFSLPNLFFLGLEFNNLTGQIPLSLLNASLLQYFQLNRNHFSGLVPRELGKLSNLREIQFSGNQLEGDLDFIASLSNCSNLIRLLVSDNFLVGRIPSSIANLSIQMEQLDLSYNQFQGSVPVGIENLINLQALFLQGNDLTGSIFHIGFGKLKKVEVVHLKGNKLRGNIPFSFGNLSKLTTLGLASNDLNGTIPPSLGNCVNMIFLDLSHNRFSGSIPTQILTSSLSVLLNLSSNAFTGPIPSEVGFLKTLGILDLSRNKLSGLIPGTISQCLSLEELYLQENSFEGKIPQGFSGLKGLKKLDISQNNFSGEISISLGGLHGLIYLNLSFNQLQGEVPKGGIFLNASAVSLQGNKGLCGGISVFKLPLCVSSPNSKNKVSIKVIVPVVVAAVIFAFFMSLLIIWYCKINPRKMKRRVPSFQYRFLRISYAELFTATNGFSVENKIDDGGYGSVYKGFLQQVGSEVAVKVLNLQRKGASHSFMSECEALKNVRHRNLLKLLSACSSIDFEGNDFKALVYQFMANGSLEKWLHEGESIYLKFIDRLNIAIDIATVIEYLHNGTSSTIIHGDLKPSNVLLDEDMIAHIGDFGLAKIISTISDNLHPYPSSNSIIKGSIGYVAPDYGMGGRISIEADVYSYGILLLEMFTGKKPTDDVFKDGLNLHTLVRRSLSHTTRGNADLRILSEERREGFEETIIIPLLRIGVGCSMEQPGERMKMESVISELQKIKRNYLKGWLEEEDR